MSVEVLADVLGLAAVPQNQGGTNYGTGGARNYYYNTTASGGFPKAVPTEMQITNYLASHTPRPTALYLISPGDNDVAYALTHTGGYVPPEVYITRQAGSLANKIKALTGSGGTGAKYIIVAGLPESFGTPAAKQQYRHLYNQTLKQKLNALGVPYLWGDVDALRNLIESFQSQSQSPFGITHYTTTSPACTKPPPNQMNPQLTIKTDWAYVCSPSMHVPSNPTDAAASEFADDNHWATGGQSVLGIYYYCLAQKSWTSLSWPSNPNLPFDCKEFSSIL
jgi:phospholipase/lecithinase/hemolysin